MLEAKSYRRSARQAPLDVEAEVSELLDRPQQPAVDESCAPRCASW